MKTKKSLHGAIGFVALLLSISSVSSCSSEQEVVKDSHQTEKNRISFEQFKQETGLRNFKTKLQVPRNADISARNEDGTYEMSDFNIDTEVIKKLVIDNKTTYTFLVRPKIVEEQSFFNLTMYYKDNAWQTSIVELKPTQVNWDLIKENPEISFQGDAKQAYKTQTVINIVQQGECSVVIVANLHCSGFSECSNGCDGCTTGENACMTLNQYAFCQQNLNSYIAPMDNLGSGGGGGGSQVPQIIDPSGYVFNPVMPYTTQEYIRIQRASKFWRNLTEDEKNWAVENSDWYIVMVDYLLNNYSVELAANMNEAFTDTMTQPVPTPDDYPGKEDGLEFEWWLYEDQVEEVMDNFYDSYEDRTEAEKRLAFLYPVPAYKMWKNVPIAFAAVTQKFGQLQAPQGLNDKIDAFRHAYFQAINTKRTTKFYAEMFSDAHESEVPAGLSKEKQMDLYNNQKGIDYAMAQSQATPEQLVDMIYDLMIYGYLVYLSPLDWVASPLYDHNSNGQQDCNACFNGITTQTQQIFTNQ